MKTIPEKDSKEKETIFVQVPRDQIQNAEQAFNTYRKNWLKKIMVKIEGSP